MPRLVRTAALLAAIMLLAATPASATRGQPDREVPFRAVSVAPTTDSYGPPTCPGAAWQFFSTGTSEATHLGLLTSEVTHCTWLDSPTTGHFGPGTARFTASNGDTLILSQWGTFRTVVTADSFTSYVDEEWVVTGGTGRFEDASGSGEASIVGNILTDSSTATYWGTITYDASDRSAD